MDSISTSTLLIVLVILILLSAFFSSSETGMMSLNRYKLRHLAQTKHKAARRVEKLLSRPDRLLGLILIGNNLINTAVPVLIANLAIHYFGNSGTTLSIATAVVAFLIIVVQGSDVLQYVFGKLYGRHKVAPLLSPSKTWEGLVGGVLAGIGGFGAFKLRRRKKVVPQLSAAVRSA